MTALSQNKQVLPIDTDTTTILPYTTSPLNPARRLAGFALSQINLFYIFFDTLWKKKRFATESR